MSSCGSSEIVNPTIKEELKTAKVSGRFQVDVNATNNADKALPYDSVSIYDNVFPAGITIAINYSQSDVNPVNTTIPSAIITKSTFAAVGTNGSYSFEIPASGKGTNITITSRNFEADYTVSDFDGPGLNTVAGATFTKKYIYTTTGVTFAKVYPGDNTLPVATYTKSTSL